MVQEPEEVHVHGLTAVWEGCGRVARVWHGHVDWERTSAAVQKVVVILPSDLKRWVTEMRRSLGRSRWVTVPWKWRLRRNS